MTTYIAVCLERTADKAMASWALEKILNGWVSGWMGDNPWTVVNTREPVEPITFCSQWLKS